MKGPISRITEESSPEKGREEAASKGHVIYEGKSGHILSYDSKYYVYTVKPILQHVTKNMAFDAPHTCFREVPEIKFPQCNLLMNLLMGCL